jgi:hypothetical protein
VLLLLDAIQGEWGIKSDEDSELADLEMETRPEVVLSEFSSLGVET